PCLVWRQYSTANVRPVACGRNALPWIIKCLCLTPSFAFRHDLDLCTRLPRSIEGVDDGKTPFGWCRQRRRREDPGIAHTSRLFCIAKNRHPRLRYGYPKGTLKRFHPGLTEVVNVTSVPEQMKIFDTVESSGTQVTLMDIKAGLMTPTLEALRDIGFIDTT